MFKWATEKLLPFLEIVFGTVSNPSITDTDCVNSSSELTIILGGPAHECASVGAVLPRVEGVFRPARLFLFLTKCVNEFKAGLISC